MVDATLPEATNLTTEIRDRSTKALSAIMNFAKKTMTLYRNSSGQDKMRLNVIFSCTGLIVFWITYMGSKAAINSSSISLSDSDSGSGINNNNYNGASVELEGLEGLGRLDNKMIEYKEDAAAKKKSNIDFVEWEKCDAKFEGKVETKVRNEPNFSTKPLLMAGYPSSIKEGFAREVFDRLTNNIHSTRSYYNSKRHHFHRCISVEYPTVACKIGDLYLKKSDIFDDSMMFEIRNPKYVFPFLHNEKAIRYHGQVGQVDVSNWRTVREQYFDKNMNTWVEILNSWATSEEYKIGFYFNYDDFVRTETGPQMMQELADLLRSSGFNVAPDEDLPCLWYQSVGKDTIEHYIDYKFDFIDYVPMYTEKEQQKMLDLLSAEITKYGPDGEYPDERLVAILKKYYEDVRDDTRIDEGY